MNILLAIHHHLDSNTGAPGATLALADAMRDSGQKVTVLSHDDLPKWARRRFAIFVFPFLVAWRAIRHRRHYDVLDFSSYSGWVATILPRRLRPRTLIAHSHGLEHIFHDRLMDDCRRGTQSVSWKYRWYRGSIHLWLVARSFRCADSASFLNSQQRLYAVEKLRVRAEKAMMAPNGLDPVLIDAAGNLTSVAPTPIALNVAFIGSYIRRKGVSYMMPALVQHLHAYPSARLSLLGVGTRVEQVLQDAPLDIHDRINVVPYFRRDELPMLLASSHIFVLASLSEGFSLAGLEAMACGLTPVVTKGHGFEEYVVDGENGYLIDIASSDQIASSLSELENNRDRWAKMRAKAIATVSRFTWENAAKKRLLIYQSARGEMPGVST